MTTQTSGENVTVRITTSPDREKISISRLPVTGPDLFGRDAELKLLDVAWADPNTNVVTFVAFVAWGGVGKTALVNTWLARMARENFRGAERVYAWSFYSQGTSDERAASADLFIDAALRWFGDDDPTKGSPWYKGERLADLIRRSRTLLVLDGLEPHEALLDIYWQRIQRGPEHFNWKKLGAFGADLAALRGFFAAPWQQPIAELSEDIQAFVLNEVGFDLRSLGRLREAAQPMQTGLAMRISQSSWGNAANAAANLIELYLTLGEIAQSLVFAQQSVELADQITNDAAILVQCFHLTINSFSGSKTISGSCKSSSAGRAIGFMQQPFNSTLSI